MKNQKYHTVGTILKSYIKILDEYGSWIYNYL